MNKTKVDINRKRKWEEPSNVRVTRQRSAETAAKRVQAAINNHIIVDNIVPYLDHTSIKNLRTLSQSLSTIIRKNRNFRDRSKFTFRKSSLFQFYLMSWIRSMPLRNLSIHLDDWDMETEFEHILDTLSSVTSLEIWPGMSLYSTETEIEMLGHLFRNCRKLKELTLDVDVFETIQNMDFSQIAADVQIQENLKQLNSLSITCAQGCGIILNPNFVSILTLLGTFPIALANFKFNHVMLDLDDVPLGREAIITILRKHARSLRSLTWDYHSWGTDPIPSIPFESLQELDFVSSDYNFSTGTGAAGRLLQEMCPLKTLKIDIRHVIGMSEGELHAALRKHCQTLRVLNLTWELAPWTEPVPVYRDAPLPPLRFSFLKSFTTLEEFKLHQTSEVTGEQGHRKKDPRASVADILSHLPDGVKRLDLGGALVKSRVPNSGSALITQSLRRFDNLQSLNLVQCPGAIDDSILAFICSEMKQLTELGFSHCNELTDFGLTGKKRRLALAHGLNSLTSLKKLRILSCSQLTRGGYINAISFEDLRELTLFSTAADINRSFYIQLLGQNKRLEVLEVPEEITKIPELEVALKKHSASSFRLLKFMEPLPEIMTPIHRYGETESSISDSDSE